MNSKVSILGEISIYTTTADGAEPLSEVMMKIHSEFNGDSGVSGSSDADELKSFMKFILPDYDEDRVYVSDIKKVANWYNLLSANYPEVFEADASEDPEKDPEA